MGRKGNSGYTNPDKRFGNVSKGYSGSIGLTQHYLERRSDNLPPDQGLVPAPGFTIWVRSTEGVTKDGSNLVTEWADKSSNGLNFTDLDTGGSFNDRKPVFRASNANLNGLPSIDMDEDEEDGSAMETANNSALNVSGTGGLCAYAVLNINNFSNFSFVMTRTNGSSWTRGWGVFYYSGDYRFWINDWNSSSTRVALANVSNTTSPYIFKLHYDESTITAAIVGNANTRNGTKSYSSTVNESGISKGIWLNYGGSTNPGTYQGDWDYGEFLFYNTPLDAAGQAQTEEYLKDRYNISGTFS